MTLTESVLFSSLRDALNDVPFIGKLVHCPYCLSHWLAFAFTPYLLVKLGYSYSLDNIVLFTADFIITSFAVVALSSFFSIGIDYFLERIDKNE